jgi:hypothetical protein
MKTLEEQEKEAEEKKAEREAYMLDRQVRLGDVEKPKTKAKSTKKSGVKVEEE